MNTRVRGEHTVKPWYRMGFLIGVAVLAIGCSSSQAPSDPGAGGSGPAQPYAGLQEREIRTLAPEKVTDLLEGRGVGYALAAELNHYPGPTHILELASELGLNRDQESTVHEIFIKMQIQAKELGGRLVELEAKLDQAFRTGEMTAAGLEQMTREIATVEGRLRYTHLAAHLETKEILTAEQVDRYDEMRGYKTANGGAHHSEGQHTGH